jgi:hypothetical protein
MVEEKQLRPTGHARRPRARGLEAYAERTEQMRTILGSDDGRAGLLRRFAGAAA